MTRTSVAWGDFSAKRCVDDRRRQSLLFFRGGVWGGGAILIISKNLPLKGKFFEMVSWEGLGGQSPPQESPLPVPCPRGVWGQSPTRNLRYGTVTRAWPPQVEVRTVKNPKMNPKRRTNLKI